MPVGEQPGLARDKQGHRASDWLDGDIACRIRVAAALLTAGANDDRLHQRLLPGRRALGAALLRRRLQGSLRAA